MFTKIFYCTCIPDYRIFSNPEITGFDLKPDPDPHQLQKWDPDQHQNVLDPPNCFVLIQLNFLTFEHKP